MANPSLPGIPALVVSGFLGAGKTTLVRHLLQNAQETGQRLAIVSNEFGELGIDQALLGSVGESGYVELQGGCVCCQLSNELLSTLQTLWERVHPDRIVVETSGVALPFETLMTFWREPVSQWVGEALALVVVNAEQLAEGRDLTGTFEQQVSSADLLVLNKIDLILPSSVGRLEAMLEEIAPGTPVVHSVNAQVDSSFLFPPTPGGLRNSRSTGKQSALPHHHESFDAREIRVANGIDSNSLTTQLKELRALRVKGFVKTSHGLHLVQGVGARFDLTPVLESAIPPDLIGRIVIIARSKHDPSRSDGST